MNAEYKEIEIDLGMELDGVIKTLQEYNVRGEKICVEFNDHTLYSDSSEDQIYRQVTGMTKAEYMKLVENEEKRMVDKFKTQ